MLLEQGRQRIQERRIEMVAGTGAEPRDLRRRLAQLAPDLQLAILRGEIVRSVDDPIWRKLPLCWTDPRRPLMPAAMAWTPVVTGS